MNNEHSTRAQLRAASSARPQKRSRRRAVRWSVGIASVVIVGGAVVVAGIAALKALDVRATLTEAIPIAAQLPGKVVAGDLDAAIADATSLKALTLEAVETTDDPFWKIAEYVPVVGQNLAAIRVAAQGVDELADFAGEAAPALDLSAIRPSGGRLDITAIRSLSTLVSSGTKTFENVEASLVGVDGSFLLPQVSDAITSLEEQVSKTADTFTSLDPVLRVLPAALGEGGTRTYLLMFQGNSELRASGGNPASMAVVTVSDGHIALTTQATSVQFDNARAQSIAALDPETEHLYSDIIGRWIPNMTATPDFPTTVAIMRAWWADEGLPPFDDVISTDPVALSYLLKTTGPIELASGETLTSENAVALLLNEVYFKYGDVATRDASEQDIFFAAAAAAVFSKLTSGVENPISLFGALARSTEEGRMKIWSSNPDIAALIAGTRLEGTLPIDNVDRTVLGTYFNDTTGAKTDYYADATVTAGVGECTAAGEPTFHQTITFADNVTEEQAAELPWFITGPHYPAGTLATDIVVYSPVGATIDSWSVKGAQSSNLIRQGSHLGRDVVRISVVTTPQTTATIDVKMTGKSGVAADAYGALDVWTTPMVRQTPVTIEAPICQ